MGSDLHGTWDGEDTGEGQPGQLFLAPSVYPEGMGVGSSGETAQLCHGPEAAGYEATLVKDLVPGYTAHGHS